ncbi:MAG: glycosyltransferase family 39 protein, partial [Snowella sp.]
YDEVLSLLLSSGQKISYHHPGDLPVILANYTTLLNLPVETNWNDILQTGKNLFRGLVAEPHPPLFFLGQHLWLRLFGNSEIAMRSLPMLFSIGAIGCAYSLGRYLLGNRGGLLLAALLGLNPYYLFHSLNVRMYSSLVFWVLLSAWSLLELLPSTAKNSNNFDHHKKHHLKILWNLTFIISVIGGLLTFYYFIIWLVTLAIIVFWLE